MAEPDRLHDELLRWIGVLRAAMLGFFAGYCLGGILIRLTETVGMVNPPSEMGFNRFLRYLIWLFPMGVAFVIAGAKMAPRFRPAMAGVLAVVWILWTGRTHHWGYEPAVAAAVAAAGGAAYICYAERSKGRRP
jgi:hypothetical protein